MIVGFAEFAFEIPALPDKFEFVNAGAFIVYIVICNNGDIPAPPENVNVSAVL